MEFRTAAKLPEDVAVVGVPVCSDDAEAGELVDLAFLADRGFEGKPGEALAFPGPSGCTVVALGVGANGSRTLDHLRIAAATLVRNAWGSANVATTLLDACGDGLDRVAAAQAIAEGAVLGSYRFDRYRSSGRPCAVEDVTVVGAAGKRLAAALERGAALGQAVAFARDLVNTPAKDLPPRALADLAIDVAERVGLTVSVLDDVDLEAARMGGILGVAAGSAEPARLVQLTYEPEKARGTLVLVGKGITFDSGGLSLKTAEGMVTMKTDMGGAAAVLAAMSVMPVVAPRCRVIGLMACAENMPSGTATRPGDVLELHDGTRVEVTNTDAEGRLVLADAIALATELEADAIVDIATLTGGATVALGKRIAPVMGNHDAWMEQVQAAADAAGERIWQLPLPDDYEELLASQVADLVNSGPRLVASSIVGGMFLRRFAQQVPWAHLDIAGTARTDEDAGYLAPGGTGFGVRTLCQLAASFKKPR